jgi:hypothetical protein
MDDGPMKAANGGGKPGEADAAGSGAYIQDMAIYSAISMT